MFIYTSKHKVSLPFRLVAFTIILAFSASMVVSPAQAQNMPYMPVPGNMVSLSPHFTPTIMRGIKIFPDNPLRFDFIIDTGTDDLRDQALREESKKLVSYFLATLTIPARDLWVNLSPYESQRVVPEAFGITQMGRDLLAQDYLLKQITASLMYPEEQLGQKFWDRVYEKTGTRDIPVNTFNKVWIVPDEATVYENGDTAFVTQSHLKVMLEEDYEAIKNIDEGATRRVARTDEMTDVIRDVIIPEIEKEVNEGENFAALRQIYHSMILATWFKRKLKNSLLDHAYVGKNNVTGVDIEDKQAKQKIYDQYLQAFKKGVYDYIKEDYDPDIQEVIERKYFSGGAGFDQIDNMMSVRRDEQRPTPKFAGSAVVAKSGGQPLGDDREVLPLMPVTKILMQGASIDLPYVEPVKINWSVNINERQDTISILITKNEKGIYQIEITQNYANRDGTAVSRKDFRTLNDGETVAMGRSRSNDMVLISLGASRVHFEISRIGDVISIRQLGQNPSFILYEVESGVENIASRNLEMLQALVPIRAKELQYSLGQYSGKVGIIFDPQTALIQQVTSDISLAHNKAIYNVTLRGELELQSGIALEAITLAVEQFNSKISELYSEAATRAADEPIDKLANDAIPKDNSVDPINVSKIVERLDELVGSFLGQLDILIETDEERYDMIRQIADRIEKFHGDFNDSLSDNEVNESLGQVYERTVAESSKGILYQIQLIKKYFESELEENISDELSAALKALEEKYSQVSAAVKDGVDIKDPRTIFNSQLLEYIIQKRSPRAVGGNAKNKFIEYFASIQSKKKPLLSTMPTELEGVDKEDIEQLMSMWPGERIQISNENGGIIYISVKREDDAGESIFELPLKITNDGQFKSVELQVGKAKSWRMRDVIRSELDVSEEVADEFISLMTRYWFRAFLAPFLDKLGFNSLQAKNVLNQNFLTELGFESSAQSSTMMSVDISTLAQPIDLEVYKDTAVEQDGMMKGDEEVALDAAMEGDDSHLIRQIRRGIPKELPPVNRLSSDPDTAMLGRDQLLALVLSSVLIGGLADQSIAEEPPEDNVVQIDSELKKKYESFFKEQMIKYTTTLFELKRDRKYSPESRKALDKRTIDSAGGIDSEFKNKLQNLLATVNDYLDNTDSRKSSDLGEKYNEARIALNNYLIARGYYIRIDLKTNRGDGQLYMKAYKMDRFEEVKLDGKNVKVAVLKSADSLLDIVNVLGHHLDGETFPCVYEGSIRESVRLTKEQIRNGEAVGFEKAIEYLKDLKTENNRPEVLRYIAEQESAIERLREWMLEQKTNAYGDSSVEDLVSVNLLLTVQHEARHRVDDDQGFDLSQKESEARAFAQELIYSSNPSIVLADWLAHFNSLTVYDIAFRRVIEKMVNDVQKLLSKENIPKELEDLQGSFLYDADFAKAEKAILGLGKLSKRDTTRLANKYLSETIKSFDKRLETDDPVAQFSVYVEALKAGGYTFNLRAEGDRVAKQFGYSEGFGKLYEDLKKKVRQRSGEQEGRISIDDVIEIAEKIVEDGMMKADQEDQAPDAAMTVETQEVPITKEELSFIQSAFRVLEEQFNLLGTLADLHKLKLAGYNIASFDDIVSKAEKEFIKHREELDFSIRKLSNSQSEQVGNALTLIRKAKKIIEMSKLAIFASINKSLIFFQNASFSFQEINKQLDDSQRVKVFDLLYGDLSDQGKTEILALSARVGRHIFTNFELTNIIKGQIINYILENPSEEMISTIEKPLRPALLSVMGVDLVALKKPQSLLMLRNLVAADAAMVGDVGGIDLNTELLNLTTEGEGVEFSVPMDEALINRIRQNGLTPVIYQIIPITNVPLFLGWVDEEGQPTDVGYEYQPDPKTRQTDQIGYLN